MKHLLWIGTADIKDLYLDVGNEKKPFLALIAQLIWCGVEVRLIHAKEPGQDFKELGEDHYKVLSYKYDVTDWLRNISNKMMREWQRQIEELLRIKLSQDNHSFGVQLNNKVWLGVWDGYTKSVSSVGVFPKIFFPTLVLCFLLCFIQ